MYAILHSQFSYICLPRAANYPYQVSGLVVCVSAGDSVDWELIGVGGKLCMCDSGASVDYTTV